MTEKQSVIEDDLYQPSHRLNRVGEHWFEYDAAGRMSSAQRLQREGYRPEYHCFIWNSQNQLIELRKPQGEVWYYRYDPFGRRTEKGCQQRGSRTTYLWDGETIAEIREYQHEQLQRVRHWVFNGWELLAQQIWVRPTELNHSNEPVSLTCTTHYAVCAPTANLWHCLTPDPIGLAGGMNLYVYAPNPLTWIDPWGLTPTFPDPKKLAKLLDTTVNTFHKVIKGLMIKDHAQELRKFLPNVKNPDIGYDGDMLAFKDPKGPKTYTTDTPIEGYKGC